MSETDPIVIFTHNSHAPSFRYRIVPLIEALKQRNISCNVYTLNSKLYGLRLVKYLRILKQARAVVLHKLKIPVFESALIHHFSRYTLYDVDDAIYLKQPKWVGQIRGLSRSRNLKFNAIVKRATLTSAGNAVLSKRAESVGARVQIFPTGIDVKNYPLPSLSLTEKEASEQVIVVWVGLPDNLRYLEMVRPVLVNIANDTPEFRFRVISSKFPDWPELSIDKVIWDADTEKSNLCSADIGIMPLCSDPYSAGKCAFKLLQYMAASLACVGSPVGANSEVVVPDSTGYLAANSHEWEVYLRALINDKALRNRFAQAGRKRAEQYYDSKVIANNLADTILVHCTPA